MVSITTLSSSHNPCPTIPNPSLNPIPLIPKSPNLVKLQSHRSSNYPTSLSLSDEIHLGFSPIVNKFHQVPSCSSSGSEPEPEGEVDSVGVKAALSMLNFYKREISPILPKSCRYVPSCSEYSMIAYKKYGVVKGTVLTAWRLCRCNPLGGSGFDPPRWFGEESAPEE